MSFYSRIQLKPNRRVHVVSMTTLNMLTTYTLFPHRQGASKVSGRYHSKSQIKLGKRVFWLCFGHVPLYTGAFELIIELSIDPSKFSLSKYSILAKPLVHSWSRLEIFLLMPSGRKRGLGPRVSDLGGALKSRRAVPDRLQECWKYMEINSLHISRAQTCVYSI